MKKILLLIIEFFQFLFTKWINSKKKAKQHKELEKEISSVSSKASGSLSDISATVERVEARISDRESQAAELAKKLLIVIIFIFCFGNISLADDAVDYKEIALRYKTLYEAAESDNRVLIDKVKTLEKTVFDYQELTARLQKAIEDESISTPTYSPWGIQTGVQYRDDDFGYYFGIIYQLGGKK
jgi:DNA repair exonuclease SbcCD ATPase subunit